MKKLTTLILVSLITGCNSTSNNPNNIQPVEENVWTSPTLSKRVSSGEITRSEELAIFNDSRASCKIESLKISVPSPSCVQPPRQDCSGLTGFSKGFCQSYTPPPNCDYSAQNQAYAAQKQVFDLCMNKLGFFLEGKSTNSIAAKNKPEEDIKDIVNSIPQLKLWYDEDGYAWQRAIQLDDEISSDPNFKDLPTRQRLLMVTKILKSELNSEVSN
ncbi:hypothetical protein [Pseudoalteromonas lipolytica]|uniref:hypothetical protein n=1 Tax=Pseudoalteromonas lipolytica TaxID=570156 RepID=UPI000C530990|nr:hypothetical protein [Pseudoalteromonas lipolytica]MAE02299.1 hypothetical protein [Pseudoalteromonas sp.]|tara:strand:- start:1329 stop:1973 length:645 start_codon:yes stop_codon:yes gene_type:complete